MPPELIGYSTSGVSYKLNTRFPGDSDDGPVPHCLRQSSPELIKLFDGVNKRNKSERRVNHDN